MTGRKTWICKNCGEVQFDHSKVCCWKETEGDYGLTEGVFLTTAQKDTLVAAAEARGAAKLAEAVCPNIFNVGTCRETITGKRCTFAANKHCAYVYDRYNSLDYTQAHTQRQRDEARAQGLVDAAEEVENHEWLSRGERDTLKEAILALRRQT